MTVCRPRSSGSSDSRAVASSISMCDGSVAGGEGGLEVEVLVLADEGVVDERAERNDGDEGAEAELAYEAAGGAECAGGG